MFLDAKAAGVGRDGLTISSREVCYQARIFPSSPLFLSWAIPSLRILAYVADDSFLGEKAMKSNLLLA